jgi:NADH:ubiquinone oxidoreductase subunit 6 (subunit J)
MFTSFGLFYFFSSLSILSSLFVITTKNPVFSILFLILSFANVSCLLFLFNFEFLPIAFLVIYVGAIAVLFLFVLMMLNIKLAELQESYFSFIPISIIFGFVFLTELLFLFRSEFVFLDIFNESSLYFLAEFLDVTNSKTSLNGFFGSTPNLKTLAVSIFNDHLFSFLIAGYILLLALVAAIILTIQKTFVSRTQNIYTQILVDYNNTIINYS